MSFFRVLSGIGLVLAGARAIREGVERSPAPQRQGEKLPSGAGMNATLERVRTLDDRMRIITGLIAEGRVDPEVIAWAAESVTGRCGGTWCVPEKDRRAEIDAVFRALRARVRYTGDVWSADTYRAARHVLRHRIADCDDYAIAGAAALGAIGIKTRCVVIHTVQSDDWDHIYLHADAGGGVWVPFDASMDRLSGWEAPASIIRRKRIFAT